MILHVASVCKITAEKAGMDVMTTSVFRFL